jgi:serine/threonine protein kinase
VKTFENFDDDEYHYCVMEAVSGGSLATHVRANGPLTESHARRVFLQLIYALEYLHGTSCVPHRDLRPENILLDKHGNLRLIDFGLAGSVTGERAITAYSSPSVAMRQRYSISSDVWSAGAVLFFLVAGHPPFDGDTVEDLTSQITIEFPFFPPSMSPSLVDLLMKTLHKGKHERITLPRIGEHPWFSAADFAQLKLRAEPDTNAIDSELLASIARSGSESKLFTTATICHTGTDHGVVYEILKREKRTDALREALHTIEDVPLPHPRKIVVASRSQQQPRVRTLRQSGSRSPGVSVLHAREEGSRRPTIPLARKDMLKPSYSAVGQSFC